MASLADRLATLENDPNIPGYAKQVIGEAVVALDFTTVWTAVKGYPFENDKPIKLVRKRK